MWHDSILVSKVKSLQGSQGGSDRAERQFRATAPNQLWIADITYVATWSGFAYTAFVTDVFSRRVIGWRTSTTLRADLALDALEIAIWTRSADDLSGFVHHSDRGVSSPRGRSCAERLTPA